MSNIKKGTLECGFEYEIDTNVISDMRFFLLLSHAETDGMAFPKAFEMLFGYDQLIALCNHLADHDIPPTVEVFDGILTELINEVRELKNS